MWLGEWGLIRVLVLLLREREAPWLASIWIGMDWLIVLVLMFVVGAWGLMERIGVGIAQVWRIAVVVVAPLSLVRLQS